MTMPTREIDATLSVYDIIRRYPAAMSLLTSRGIDPSSDGGLTLCTAAADADVDLSTLVSDLAAAVANGEKHPR
jgi:iron-sulfur cluster repair protein YtfE (RIC family)